MFHLVMFGLNMAAWPVAIVGAFGWLPKLCRCRNWLVGVVACVVGLVSAAGGNNATWPHAFICAEWVFGLAIYTLSYRHSRPRCPCRNGRRRGRRSLKQWAKAKLPKIGLRRPLPQPA